MVPANKGREIGRHKLKYRKHLPCTIAIGLSRTISISLIMISLFLLVPLAHAAAPGNIKVWTDKTTYQVGDYVTYFWEKNNTCLNTPGAAFALRVMGPNFPTETAPVDDPTTGTYTAQIPIDSTGIGTWSVSIQVAASNCQATGATTFKAVAAAVPEFPVSPLIPLLAVAVLLALAGGQVGARRNPRNAR